MSQRNVRAFTLIELMVVVAVIALIAALLIPNILRVRENARKRAPTQANQGHASAPEASPPESKPVPEISALHARLELVSWSTRSGMDVTNRYRLHYQANLEVRGNRQGEQVLLRIPFPRDTEEASNVRVQSSSGTVEWSVDRWGLLIPLELQGGEGIRLDVAFQALGRDQMVLELPPTQKLGQFQLQLQANPESGVRLSESSLQATRSSPAQWEWAFDNLVSQAPLILELPGSHSLTAKVLSLCRLAGLAVFLFGLGFWYLGELYRPGCLSKFRWGHFLMLALTYSSFFPALSVLSLGQGLELGASLAIALALAQPLLLLHVWRSIDLRFAILYVLPLAILTLGIVVNGVFGGEWRDLVFLGSGFFCVAFVSLSYPRWSEHRRQFAAHNLGLIKQRVQQLQSSCEPLRQLLTQALALQPLLSNGEKSQLDSSNYFINEIDRQSRFLDAHSLSALETRLPEEIQLLTNLCRRHSLAKDLDVSQSSHCLRCGQTGPNSTFCGDCGTKKAVQVKCLCGMQMWLSALPTRAYHCPCCGLKHDPRPHQGS